MEQLLWWIALVALVACCMLMGALAWAIAKPHRNSRDMAQCQRISKKRQRDRLMQFDEKSIGLVACWADQAGQTYDEDRGQCGSSDNVSVVSIADGVSEMHTSRADIAAEAAVRAFVQRCTQFSTEPSPSLIEQAYRSAATAISDKLKEKGLLSTPATTLLAAIEWGEWLVLTYLGDGCVLLADGTLDQNSMILFGGRLRGNLKPGQVVGTPILIFYKKSSPYGEVILLGTDGILNAESEEDQGRTRTIASEVLRRLQTRCRQKGRDFSQGEAESVLRDFIQESLNRDSPWHYLTYSDNQTLGVLITRRTINYWLSGNDDIEGLYAT